MRGFSVFVSLPLEFLKKLVIYTYKIFNLLKFSITAIETDWKSFRQLEFSKVANLTFDS